MLVVQGNDPSVFLDGIRSARDCPLLREPGRELGAIHSGVAILFAEETLHTRLV